MFAIDLREDSSAILIVGKEGRETNILWACTMCQMTRYFLDFFFSFIPHINLVKTDIIILIFLHLRYLRHRDAKYLVQNHTARK